MYAKAYGIIKTLAPLHVGATDGEESGNLNLIFRDRFTQTGIVPGSSLRGRLRAEMRSDRGEEEASFWFGNKAVSTVSDSTSESRVKIETASLLWLPVFCPGQPIVWVSCPRLLRRYQRLAGELEKNAEGTLLKELEVPQAYRRSRSLKPLKVGDEEKLFFNFGYLTIEDEEDLSVWFPSSKELPAVIVADDEMGMIHDMALYRQSRVRLEDNEKVVARGAFFNVEALPEDTHLIFAVALRPHPEKTWQPFPGGTTGELYLGGLESVGFGCCSVTIKGV